MADYVFMLRQVRKTIGDKLVLDDVTLAFLPDAKIGVVGPNGDGTPNATYMSTWP